MKMITISKKQFGTKFPFLKKIPAKPTNILDLVDKLDFLELLTCLAAAGKGGERCIYAFWALFIGKPNPDFFPDDYTLDSVAEIVLDKFINGDYTGGGDKRLNLTEVFVSSCFTKLAEIVFIYTMLKPESWTKEQLVLLIDNVDENGDFIVPIPTSFQLWQEREAALVKASKGWHRAYLSELETGGIVS
jgi:hypothetical protein